MYTCSCSCKLVVLLSVSAMLLDNFISVWQVLLDSFISVWQVKIDPATAKSTCLYQTARCSYCCITGEPKDLLEMLLHHKKEMEDEGKEDMSVITEAHIRQTVGDVFGGMYCNCSYKIFFYFRHALINFSPFLSSFTQSTILVQKFLNVFYIFFF